MSFVTEVGAASLARTRWLAAGLRLDLKFLRLRFLFKAGFDPNQPRAPAGQADGGRWVDDGGGSFRVAQSAPRGGGGRNRGGLDGSREVNARSGHAARVCSGWRFSQHRAGPQIRRSLEAAPRRL
jgi:hypothetical protein